MKPAMAIGITAILLAATPLFQNTASARTAYDGAWSLDFATQRGDCSTYHFDVNIADGIVSHPNLVRFTGRVNAAGLVRASVAVQNKFASGSGRLAQTTGRGTWSGQDGSAHCSGVWTAQKS